MTNKELQARLAAIQDEGAATRKRITAAVLAGEDTSEPRAGLLQLDAEMVALEQEHARHLDDDAAAAKIASAEFMSEGIRKITAGVKARMDLLKPPPAPRKTKGEQL